MKKLLLLSICFLTLFNLNAQYGACHPDCLDSDDYEKCTERKIKKFISSHLKSNDAFKDDSGIIIGKIEIGVSITGSLSLDAIELSEGSEKQRNIIKEAFDMFAYAITFDPASIKKRKPTEDILKYNITFEGTPNDAKGKYDGEIFKVVEQMPRFPGCEDMAAEDREKKACADKKMLQYIYSNLQYPSEARENNVEGTCVVQFIVGVDGILKDFKLVRDIGAGCGEEALRVVSTMNDMDEYWTPGYQRGEAIEVQFNLPLKFRLGYNDSIIDKTNSPINRTKSSTNKTKSSSSTSKQAFKDYTVKEYLSLTDEIHLLTLFVDTDKDYWESEEVDYYYDQLLISQEWIQEQASYYNQHVEFNNDYFFTNNKSVVHINEVRIGDHPKKTIQKLMDDLGYEDLNNFFSRNRFDFKKKKFKIIIFVKDSSRSHAYNYWSVKDVDLAVVYCKSTYGTITSHYTISHELLHQFGAWDLYFGKSQTMENAQKAKELYPNSVMISSGYKPSSINVDELTAWRIGWGNFKDEYRQFDPQYNKEDKIKESRTRNSKSIKFDLKGNRTKENSN